MTLPQLKKRLQEFVAITKHRYTARHDNEILLLHQIWQSLDPKEIVVVGGATCFDLFSSLAGRQCDIFNYDGFENRFNRNESDVKSEIYSLQKFFDFRGKHVLIKKNIYDFKKIKHDSKVVIVNDKQADLGFFGDDLNLWPDTIIMSHFGWVPSIFSMLTNQSFYDKMPLFAITNSMMCFSRKNIDFSGIENLGKKQNFGKIQDVFTMDTRFSPSPYKSIVPDS